MRLEPRRFAIIALLLGLIAACGDADDSSPTDPCDGHDGMEMTDFSLAPRSIEEGGEARWEVEMSVCGFETAPEDAYAFVDLPSAPMVDSDGFRVEGDTIILQNIRSDWASNMLPGEYEVVGRAHGEDYVEVEGRDTLEIKSNE